MLKFIAFSLLGFAGLFIGASWMVRGAARLASSFNVSPLIIGMTIIAFGTSMPELLVSLNAATHGSSAMAVGGILGSNIANLGLVLGITAILSPITVDGRLMKIELPIMVGISILILVMSLDGLIGRFDGVILLLGFIIFTLTLIFVTGKNRDELEEEFAEFEEEAGYIRKNHRIEEIARTIIGLIILIIGARFLVIGATEIARNFGISDLVIGFTLLALGTSLPELATAITAIRHDESDIIIGSAIGSNISNLLLILSITALVSPMDVSDPLIRMEFFVMIGFSLLLIPFVFDRKIERWEGIVYIVGYTLFMIFLFTR